MSFAGFQGLSYLHEFSFILFIHHNIHIYIELCTYCKICDIYPLWNMNSVKYLLFYMELFCDMFGSVLECYELTHISWSCWSAESCMSEHALLPHWLCNQKHRWPVNSPQKRLVTRKMFPFDDVIIKMKMESSETSSCDTYSPWHYTETVI